MRRSLILVPTLLLLAWPMAQVRAQEQLTLSRRLEGLHRTPVIATDPNTGNALAVWVTVDPRDPGIRTVWASLLKRGRNGRYKARKPREIASGGSRNEPIRNQAPEVVWAPGMRNFFVVWEAALADGSREIRGRVVKARTGKPKGGVRLLAGDGTSHFAAEVDAGLVDGRHAGVVAYLREPGEAEDGTDFELTLRQFKRNGKPDGQPVLLEAFDRAFAFVSGLFLVGPDPAGAARVKASSSPPPVWVYHGPVSDEGDSSEQKCFLRLIDGGRILDEEEVPCGVMRRRTSQQVVVIYRRDGEWFKQFFHAFDGATISPDGPEFRITSPGEMLVWAIVGDPLQRTQDAPGRTDVPTAQAGSDTVFLATTRASSLQVLRVERRGRGTPTVASPYSGGLPGLDGGFVGPEQAALVWIGRVRSGDDEEVRATIVQVR